MELGFIAPVILVAVAMHQRWRMRALRQSAWKGGGFGMFSDIQRSYASSTLVCEEPGGPKERTVDPSSADALVSRIPSEDHMKRYARSLSQRLWQGSGHAGARPTPLYMEGPSLNVTGVRVRHRWIDFDGETGHYTGVDVNVVYVAVAPESPNERSG